MERNRLLDEWNDLKASLKDHWTKLTEEDLAKFDATLAALVDTVRDRYGVSRECAHGEVRDYFAGLRTGVRAAAEQVRDTASDLWDRGRERVRAGVDAGRERLHEKPLQALALAAGAGAILALLLRRK
jgi:ElaB/YqjD/DUF883 family membrane-anchored ribosome-binding protein